MMNVLYIVLGLILIIFGIWLIRREVRIFIRGQQDDLGYDIKGLIFGITTIIGGIILIVNNISK